MKIDIAELYRSAQSLMDELDISPHEVGLGDVQGGPTKRQLRESLFDRILEAIQGLNMESLEAYANAGIANPEKEDPDVRERRILAGEERCTMDYFHLPMSHTWFDEAPLLDPHALLAWGAASALGAAMLDLVIASRKRIPAWRKQSVAA